MENSTAQNIIEERSMDLGSKENLLPIFSHEEMRKHLACLSHFINLYIDGELIEQYDIAFPEGFQESEFLPKKDEYTKFKCFKNKIEIFMKDGSVRTFKGLNKIYLNKQEFTEYIQENITYIKDICNINLYGFEMEYRLFENIESIYKNKRSLGFSSSKSKSKEFKINEFINEIDEIYTIDGVKLTSTELLAVETVEPKPPIIVDSIKEGRLCKYYIYPITGPEED